MPPPILNDSEDDEDVVVYDDSVQSSSHASGEAAPAITLDGTRDTLNQSTGSTERLKRQINEAQRSLCEGSSGQPQPSTESPTLKRDKRRHSGAQPAVAEPAVSAVKRSKTVTIYSSKKPTSSSLEREKFLATYGQDATLPDNSPSAHFSGNYGAVGSGDLPVSSLLSGFANHDPAMFKESGSTVADNESSHERMVEQALRSKSLNVQTSPEIKLVQSDELARSSSFPWSASEPTESAKNNRAKGTQASAVETGEEAKTSDHHVHGESHSTHLPVISEHDIPLPPTAVMIAPSKNTGVQESSPTVEITTRDVAAPSLPEPPVPASTETKQKAARGRKRKVQEESSEPLNSDDIAVGLPKERYKPRPSRRRATETTEELIDYSVVPEKAAKAKRSKTIGGGLDTPEHPPPVKGKLPSLSSTRKTKPAKVVDETDAETTTIDKASQNQAAHQISTIPQTSSPVVELPGVEKVQPSQATPRTEAAPEIKETPKEDFAFAKPAPKSRPASKSIRSSTTIFEDHVGLTGKSRSPSLSQQQAIRKSILIDVKNEASPAKPRRGAKHVVPDDDDDEDELALEPAQEEQPPPVEEPKKRGRGRPSKAAAAKASKKASTKPAKPTTHDSESEDDEIALMPPPKKRRGRPPKSAAAVDEDLDNSKDAENTDASVLEPEKKAAPAKQPEQPVDEPTKESTPAKQVATEIPTPSPELQPPAPAEESAAPKKPAKVSPPAHSPIKSSSPAPYRVGLSKKHRIPSLLRVMRPPPPKRG